jgi:hypothetical protein
MTLLASSWISDKYSDATVRQIIWALAKQGSLHSVSIIKVRKKTVAEKRTTKTITYIRPCLIET